MNEKQISINLLSRIFHRDSNDWVPSTTCHNYRDYVGSATVHKVAIMGAPRVGKTAIFKRFLGAPLPSAYVPTLQETVTTPVEIVGGATQAVEITDTSGSNEFPAMYELCINRSTAFVLVYSPTCAKSYETVRKIIDDIGRLKESLDGVRIAVVCNRYKDTPHDSHMVVSPEGWELVNVSAVENENVDAILNVLFTRKMSPDSTQKAKNSKGKQRNILNLSGTNRSNPM